jgi:hypothetical protein
MKPRVLGGLVVALCVAACVGTAGLPGGGAAGGDGGESGGGGGDSSGGGGAAAGGGSAGGGPAGAFTPGPAGCQALTLERDLNLGGYLVERYHFSDAACRPRTAALVHNDQPDPGGSRGGHLREFTYEAAGATRTVLGTGANGLWNGWGYVVNHYGSGADLSTGRTGTYQVLLAGPHHAIHQFKLRMSPGGPVDVTVRWFFATGRSAPVYDIAYDATPAGPNVVNADSRAPYGDLAFEGTAGPIGGVGWGDDHRFTTTGAGPVTFATPWDYTAPNLVPYVRMWSSAVDAEMGAVQTQTFARRIGGGDYGGGLLAQQCQGKTSATQGPSCATAGNTMPTDWMWPFQLNQYELPFTTLSHRLAWGLNYGAVGQTTVSAFGRTYSGYPTLHYAVALVLGLRSTEATLAQVTELEHELAAVVTGATWNEGFAGWEGAAVAGGTTLVFDPRGGAVTNPVLHLTGFGAATPSVTLDGAALVADQGYFATSDPSDGSLWLTLGGTVSASVELRVQ